MSRSWQHTPPEKSVFARAFEWAFPPPPTLEQVSKEQMRRLAHVERSIQRRMEDRRRTIARLRLELTKEAAATMGQPTSVIKAKQLLRQQDFLAADETRLDVLQTLKSHVETIADSVTMAKGMKDATALVQRVNRYLPPQQAGRMLRAFTMSMEANAFTQKNITTVIDEVADDQGTDVEERVDDVASNDRVAELLEKIEKDAALKEQERVVKQAKLAALRQQRVVATAVAAPVPPLLADEETAADDALALRLKELSSTPASERRSD